MSDSTIGDSAIRGFSDSGIQGFEDERFEDQGFGISDEGLGIPVGAGVAREPSIPQLVPSEATRNIRKWRPWPTLTGN